MKAFIQSCVLSALLFGCASTGIVEETHLKYTHWQLTHMAGKAIKNSPISIEFIEAMQVAGNAGCNRFFGQGLLSESRLQVSQLGMTRKLCDANTNTTEQVLLKMLEKGVPITMVNGVLIFKGQPELRFQVAG